MEAKKKLKQVVAYRGQLTTLDDFIKRLQDRGEITSQDVVNDLSIAWFEAKNLDYRSKDIHEDLKGIGKGEVVLVDKKFLDAVGATFKKAPTSSFANHALMSNAEAADVFKIFKSSGVHFQYDGA